MNLAQDRGNWLQTLTGVEFYPLDPRPEDIRLDDIAGALSKMCRFGGHCKRFYSVAEHSILMAVAAPLYLKRAALFHDASEAYLVDIPRPIKAYLTNYADIESGIMDAIAKKYKFAWPLHADVKKLDNAILNDERAQAMTPTTGYWDCEVVPPLGVTLQFWSPQEAERHFLDFYNHLALNDV